MATEMSKRNAQVVAERATRYLKGLGYSAINPRGLISDAFPDTFAPSAFHDEVLACVHGAGAEQNLKQVGVDWVFRHVDIDRVAASPFHLSAFEMAVFFMAAERNGDDAALREATVGHFVGVLRALGLELRGCTVTYFGGRRFSNMLVPSDEEVVTLWEKHGVDHRRLIRVPGSACFTNCQRPGEAAGPRCEVFLPARNGTMVEVGTVVFERFVIGRDWELASSPRLVYGGALGIERVAMLLAGLEDVIMIPDLNPLVQSLLAGIDSRLLPLCQQQIRGAIDAIRTLVVVRSQAQELNKRRQQRVKAVARRIGRYLADLGIEDLSGALTERLCRLAAAAVAAHSNVISKVVDDIAQSRAAR